MAPPSRGRFGRQEVLALIVGGVMLSGLVGAVVVANRPPERRRVPVEAKATEAPPAQVQPLPAEPPPPASAPPPAVVSTVVPQLEETRGSATFPVESIRLDTRRDLIRVSTAFAALTGLEPDQKYLINEFGAPPNRPPVFFLLAGQGLAADEVVGVVPVGSATEVKGARAVMFFTVGPQEEGGPKRRTVRVENMETHVTANVSVFPSQVSASLNKAFELNGLDGLLTYQLTLEPVEAAAYTRGVAGGAVRKVACARQSSEEVWYAGDDSNGFLREQQFLLVEGQPVEVWGTSAVRCGFIDDDAEDNQGELRLRIVSRGRTREMEPVAPEVRGRGDEAKRLYEEGVTLTRKRKLSEAELRLLKCLDVEPSYAPCYLALGSLKARSNDPESGAMYYRVFLRLAPNDARAPLVKRLLAEYDKRHRLE